MERGLHFMCWYPEYYNYHPSLPIKRVQMIEDIVGYRGTVLIWSCLGGGAIGPQWLEHEAYGKVDPRLRIYGHMNDSEFIAECQKKGIKVFGVIFCSQMWEFPIETDKDESEILCMNVLRGVGKRNWLGIRELSTDRYPKIFKSFKEYFPQGLINSDGETVVDLLEECQTRDLHNEPIYADWLEVANHEHHCYVPCKNNPVTIAYFKKLVEMLIDAGVDGIHFDEVDSQFIALERGGCFCKDCVKGFREYLKREGCDFLSPSELNHFDYAKYLRGRGINFQKARDKVPLIKEYKNFLLENVYKNMEELSTHARKYAKEQGKEILISQNHYDALDIYYPLVKFADVIGGEKAKLGVRQPQWYKTAVAFAQSKPTLFIEDPYNSIVPKMYSNIKKGQDDLYTLFMLEAFVHGINMSIPYGAWLGNKTRDSFWPPREATKKIGDFLAQHEDLFTSPSYSKVCLFYPFPNLFEAPYLERKHQKSIYWEIAEFLCKNHINYDVLYLHDAEMVPDNLSTTVLEKYTVCLLPHIRELTENQIATLRHYVRKGGKVIVIGTSRLNESKLNTLISEKGFDVYSRSEKEKLASILKGLLRENLLIEPTPGGNIGIQLYDIEDNKIAAHILNYDYNEQTGEIDPVPSLKVKINSGKKLGDVSIAPFGNTSLRVKKDFNLLELKNLHIYCVMLFELV